MNHKQQRAALRAYAEKHNRFWLAYMCDVRTWVNMVGAGIPGEAPMAFSDWMKSMGEEV